VKTFCESNLWNQPLQASNLWKQSVKAIRESNLAHKVRGRICICMRADISNFIVLKTYAQHTFALRPVAYTC